MRQDKSQLVAQHLGLFVKKKNLLKKFVINLRDLVSLNISSFNPVRNPTSLNYQLNWRNLTPLGLHTSNRRETSGVGPWSDKWTENATTA